MPTSIELGFIPLKVNKRTKRAFVKWADKNGWLPYDSVDTWINLKQRSVLRSAKELYEQYQLTRKQVN